MRCPFCGHPDTKVTDSREADDGIRRRRECLQCERRFTTYERVQAAPLMVVKKDGRREEFSREKVRAGIRRSCDKRLRDAMITLADSSRLHNPWAKDIYLRASERGCDHPHALRVLGRAWVRVIWRMWQDGAPYVPSKHGARKDLNAAGG